MQRKINFLTVIILCLMMLLGCQTTEKVNSSADTDPLVIATPKANLDDLTPDQRQDLRVWLDTFYDGTPDQWELARTNVINLGQVGKDALCIFLVKFFFGGKQQIPLGSRSEDIAEYWERARHELVRMKGEAVPYIIAAMAQPQIGTTGRMQCSLTLVQIGEPAVPVLIANLNRGERRFQRMALETLAKIQSPQSAGPISSFYLQLPQPAQVSDDLSDDPTIDVRYYAIKALGKIPSSEGIPALRKALYDVNELVVKQALQSLLELNNPATLPVLKEALQVCKGQFLAYRSHITRRIELLESLPY